MKHDYKIIAIVEYFIPAKEISINYIYAPY